MTDPPIHGARGDERIRTAVCVVAANRTSPDTYVYWKVDSDAAGCVANTGRTSWDDRCESLPSQSEDWHENDVAVAVARRALADTGGDTA